MYRISIIPEPEVFNGKSMYFWCVLRQVETKEFVNCGHGYSESIEQAATDANNMYKQIITCDQQQYII